MSDIKDSYVYVESKSQDQTCIGIKGGKFAGVIYKYGKVSLGEETEDGHMPFKFEFDIVDNNSVPREEFFNIGHRIDDYLCSRNIAKYGLKVKYIDDI